MQSIRAASLCLSVLSGLGLAANSSDACAGNPSCDPCAAHVVIAPTLMPVVAVEAPVVVSGLSVVQGPAPVIPIGHALLILNCPAEARVTIDGRVTHSSGKTRQYHLTFDGDVHDCLVEIRLRDNEEHVTYEFHESLPCVNHQRLVRTVTRRQMEPEPDRHPAEEAARLLAPGTLLRVTDDKRLEPVSTAAERTLDLPPEPPPTDAKPTEPTEKPDGQSPPPSKAPGDRQRPGRSSR